MIFIPSKITCAIKSTSFKDLAFTFINQIWRLVSGPLTMIFIPLFLSEVEQGYWYLFGSLSALSIFADLGFSNIILQFSAHEFAHLHFQGDGTLTGDEDAKKRLGSFLRFSIKWLSGISAIVFPVVFVVGIIVITSQQNAVAWFFPWVLFLIGSLINFMNNSILSFVEGLNKIAVVQKIRFAVAVVNTAVILTLLALGFKLFALAIASIISASLIFFAIFGTFRNIFTDLFTCTKRFVYNWKKKIFGLMTKYAFSFVSGYFIFQIYTPIAYSTHGAVFSGKIGISITLFTAIFGIANIWIYTVTPHMNMLVSKKDWKSLDALFKKRLLLSCGTYLLGVSAAFLLLYILPIYFPIATKITGRFLPVTPLIMLASCWFLQLIMSTLAVYLRAHKEEPLVIPSIVSAVVIAIGTVLSAYFLSPDLFFTGFGSSYIFGLPWVLIIFYTKRKVWHG